MQNELFGLDPDDDRGFGGLLEQSGISDVGPAVGEAAAAAYIVGINEAGKESGNEGFTEGRDLPWLQDSIGTDVWGLWEVDYRDVIILDSDNQFYAVYNLSRNDLNVEANYQTLMALILEATP
jgi:hypothetical protein